VFDNVIYQHPGGFPIYYLNELHQVFGFRSVQMVGYIERFDVFDLNGMPTHIIDGNYLIPSDRSQPPRSISRRTSYRCTSRIWNALKRRSAASKRYSHCNNNLGATSTALR